MKAIVSKLCSSFASGLRRKTDGASIAVVDRKDRPDQFRPSRRLGILGLLAVSLAGLGLAAPKASAQTVWSLTNDQRRAYLNYYAPVIFKRANANNGDHGLDWITNFDFDGDKNFSNNKENWKNIDAYIDAPARGSHPVYQYWNIRPTVYTAIIERMQSNGVKDLVLIYHIYHALDKKADGNWQLHDWERVELKVAIGVPYSNPGAWGQGVVYGVVTQHHRNVVRNASSKYFKFLETSTGKHLMLWQAEWSDKIGAAHGNELRFIAETGDTIKTASKSTTLKAVVDVNNDDGKKNMHYAFVPNGSSDAVTLFNAQAITHATANSLASRFDNGATTTWSNVKRVTYELQDLADIIPTHWAGTNYGGGYATHWLSTNPVKFVFESPVINDNGGNETLAGTQYFYPDTRDSENDDIRSGIITKNWMFGIYECKADAADWSTTKYHTFSDSAWASSTKDSNGYTRATASGKTDSPNNYWWQHDYFLHTGALSTTDGVEIGEWLRGDWYKEANGGFDGRWIQLFPRP